METLPENLLSMETKRLAEEEARLDEQVRAMQESLSGLRDIDLTLTLASTKLALCMQLMKLSLSPSGADARETLGTRITETSLAALRMVDALLAENVSEDQRGSVQARPLYAGFRARLQEFLLAGGGGYLEVRQTDARRRRILARTIAAAVRKFTGPDDRYPPLEVEEYPPFIKRLLLFLFPVMVREHPERPPYGIEEGHEVIYSSQKMKLPLSQAVFYLENDLIPELEKKLAESPGSASIQGEIRRAREKAEELKKLRFFPRPTPVLLENGFYTDGMTSYTTDGEMLVPIPLPVSFRSGTNLDRVMELVRMDVVRRIAGRGVSSIVDEEYRHLRSLESGIRGNSRMASMKIDTAWGFRVLRQDFPVLARLADKESFKELVDMVHGKAGAERRIESLMEKDEAGAALPMPALGHEQV
jgi:hypothetical protein